MYLVLDFNQEEVQIKKKMTMMMKNMVVEQILMNLKVIEVIDLVIVQHMMQRIEKQMIFGIQ